jgi:ABC-type polysaccharide/polyol phosphate transport system ATPase subunit
MSSDVLISVENVRKKFCRSLRRSLMYGMQDIAADLLRMPRHGLRQGEFYAVDGLSVDLRRGECLGIIGRNGAGKTTLLKMLNGIIKPDEGRIRVRGRVGALIALGAGFNPLLSGRENIYVNGAILGMKKAEIQAKLNSIIDFSELRDFIDAPVQGYSSGMVVRLGFAIAVHCHPDSLLLDEVLAVGDSAFQAKCFNALSEMRNRGIGFILVSHNLGAIDWYCDRVLYIRKGRCAYVGNPQEAIVEYNRDLLNDDLTSANGVPGATVNGNGKVVVREIVFLGASGTPVTEIRSGEPLTLRLVYDCRGSIAMPTVVQVHIKDQSGVFFHHPHAVEIKNLKGTGNIDVSFDAIPANNQRLLFSVALYEMRSRELFDWKPDIPLIVNGVASSRGRVHLSFRSTVTPHDSGHASIGDTSTSDSNRFEPVVRR